MNEMYLIEKKGYYYRPNAEGYTVLKSEAGRYSFEDAAVYVGPNGPDGSQDSMVMWAETEAPDYSSGCDGMTKLQEQNRILTEKLKIAEQEIFLYKSKLTFSEQIEISGKKYANIHSKRGTKIRFMAEGGNDYQKQESKKILTVGKIYTLWFAEIDTSSTDFILEEFPDKRFNSSLFYRIEEDE
jgi:hypothetical protein